MINQNDLMMSLHIFFALGGSPLVGNHLMRQLEAAIRETEERIAELKGKPYQTRSVDLEVARATFNLHFMRSRLNKLRDQVNTMNMEEE